MARLQITFLAILSFIASVLAVAPLEVRGSDFVDSETGMRFEIIGVAYQPGGSSGFDPSSGVDALSDASVCLRDATLLQRLGVNTIRVYNLDPDLNHAECASIFNAAGIYMILDVNSPLPNQSLDRGAPWTTYTSAYVERIFDVVAAFMNFPNTLGFFSGNEVINQDSVPQVPDYIRAVTRDLKDFISKQSPRSIPVGYSAADVRPLLQGTFDVLSCEIENATSSKIDFFGLNSYSWCGDATFQSSGYDVLTEDFGNTTIPVFFSEYGCNLVSPRVFTEVPALYSDPMNNVFSGGLVYEYSEEPNNYGLVNITSSGDINILEDYNNLQKQYDSLDLNLLTKQNSTATSLQPPTCDADLLDGANFTTSFDLPTRPDGVDQLIASGVSGKFPTGTVAVTNTKPTQSVTGANGQAITGLELKILANGQSNLPGNNTSGTSSSNATSTSSGSSPTKTNNAPAQIPIQTGSLVLGALLFGLFTQL